MTMEFYIEVASIALMTATILTLVILTVLDETRRY
jgi:hypothetical protein